jgi:hypothetical protein
MQLSNYEDVFGIPPSKFIYKLSNFMETSIANILLWASMQCATWILSVVLVRKKCTLHCSYLCCSCLHFKHSLTWFSIVVDTNNNNDTGGQYLWKMQ